MSLLAAEKKAFRGPSMEEMGHYEGEGIFYLHTLNRTLEKTPFVFKLQVAINKKEYLNM
jgi:hypothetical protein